ncbi:RNA polymerase sigma-54 factor [Tabrizicola sp.]|uniref:RNA polymerase factor sigma-54 n=1 Tax=Tabrizicola sp. TaxID=2005166 RepID=UPI0035AFB2E1
MASGIDLGLRQRGALAMTPALRQAIGLISLSNAELSARLADLTAGSAVLGVAVGAGAEDWLTLSRQIAPPPSGHRRPLQEMRRGPGGMDTDRIPLAEPGLISHVEAQLPLLVRDAEDRRIARIFLHALEPSGWLGAGLEEIATEAGCPAARAEAVLRQLQAAEPTGLFARSLAECLALQAEEQGLLTQPFAALLRNLPLLAAGRTEALAEACGCGEETVREMACSLRRLNPKPGAGFAQAASAGHPADLILRRDGEGWLLELNAETLPTLRLTPGAAAPPEALREARALVQALERRHATALSVAAEIVTRQDAHLRGAGPPAALTINDLAAATGLHRSTISRVTAALVLSMPGRTLGLRDLICAPVPAARRQEEPLSLQAVLARMREIVAGEDPVHPLTDKAIAQLLLPEGAALARRTVVKYRGLAGIPPRAARRRPA